MTPRGCLQEFDEIRHSVSPLSGCAPGVVSAVHRAVAHPLRGAFSNECAVAEDTMDEHVMAVLPRLPEPEPESLCAPFHPYAGIRAVWEAQYMPLSWALRWADSCHHQREPGRSKRPGRKIKHRGPCCADTDAMCRGAAR